MSGVPKVTISRGNGNLTPQSPAQDGETLLVIGSPFVDLSAASGIFGSYEEYATSRSGFLDSANRIAIEQHVRHFFLNAVGQKLHLQVIYTSYIVDMLTPANAAYVIIHNYIVAQNGKIKLLALVENLDTPADPTGYDAGSDALAAITLGQTFANLHEAAGRPFHVLLSAKVTFASAVPDLRALSAPSVSIHLFRHEAEIAALTASIATPNAGELGAIAQLMHTGYVAGKIAGIPVQRNVGRVLDGSITNKLPGTLLHATNNPVGKEAEFTDKGFIIVVRHPGKDGYFFNDDPSCALLTNDYNSIARNRIINKAESIARAVFTDRLNDEIDINPTIGLISAAAAKGFETEVKSAIETQMIAKGECVAVQVFVDPAQNVQLTSTVNIVLSILPYAHAKFINVTVQFTQTIA